VKLAQRIHHTGSISLKKALLALVAVVVIVGAGLVWFVTRLPSSPFDGEAPQQTAAAELIQRGEYVARQADCVACHSLPGRKPFAGGLEMGTPLGSIFATNVSPDKTNGIGNYSLADFDRAVRQGVTPDGRRLYPAMPYPSYVKMNDEDMRALYAFFMDGVEPVAEPNKVAEIEWPLNIRWPLALWNVVFTESGTYTAKADQDELWNRGAYLVQAAGHCGSCHTPRSVTMAEKGLDESNTEYLAGALLDGWYAPSLRQDHNTGLGRWTEEDIFAFLKNGRNKHAVVFGSMSEAYNNSLAFMTDPDLQSMSRYLKSLPGNPDRDGEPWQYPVNFTAPTVAERRTITGAQTYETKCGFCHGPDGRGRNQWIPPLAGAASSLTEQSASQINVTLNGSARVVTDGVPDSYRMPAYRDQLSDQQISDVLSYVRSAWGNHGGKVTAEEIKALREHTDPASSNPIVLQMR
jgi:mono/diheme cytochrome c family protein